MAEANSTVEYRDIPGFPGYRVGSDGTVWSALKRVGVPGVKDGGTRSIVGTTWHKLSTRPDRKGYLIICLRKSGRAHTCTVHKLILLAFVGPCPEGMECCHNDGNKQNNAPANLRWDTRKANAADNIRHGKTRRGELSSQAKLSDDQVRAIRAKFAAARGRIRVRRGTLPALAREFGVSISAIGQIARKEIWRHVE